MCAVPGGGATAEERLQVERTATAAVSFTMVFVCKHKWKMDTENTQKSTSTKKVRASVQRKATAIAVFLRAMDGEACEIKGARTRAEGIPAKALSSLRMYRRVVL